MKLCVKNSFRWVVLLGLLGVLCSSASAAKWWLSTCPARVSATLEKLPASKLPGSDIAVVTIRTAGLCRKDGQDVRVATIAGKEMPRRILQVGPGDVLRVAFAIKPKEKKYFVYFGKAKPASIAKKQPLDIRRGVLLEMWRYNGGHARRFKEVAGTLARAKKKGQIGCDFRKRVFSGHNPFGPQTKIAAVYTAYFVAPVDGEYGFGLSSRNASFLEVDGKVVTEFGGWHGPTRRIRRRGSIRLSKGQHKLKFYHISPWSNPVAVLMWKLPDGRWHLMPPVAFSPIAVAKAGPLERHGRGASIDFAISPGGETFLENRYHQRRGFTALCTGKDAKKLKWTWDFGDGVKTKGLTAEHVYLRPGEYKVTLRASGYLSPLEITHRVAIDRDWDKVTRNKLDRVADHAKIVAGYDLARLSSANLREAVLLFRRAKDSANMRKACGRFMDKKTAADSEIRQVLPIYVEALLKAKRPQKAVEVLTQAAGMTKTPAIKADMLVRAANVQLDDLNDPAAARKTFTDVIDKYASQTTDPVIRRARIGLGDVWRAMGKYAKAAAAYKLAGITDKRAKKFRPIVKGDFARKAEDYLRRKDYPAALEALDKWEETFPLDRLEGYSTLLRVEYLYARRQYSPAARQAQRLVKVNPGSNYAPELLMHAARAYTKLRQGDKAIKTLKRIIRDYRESPISNEAMKMLRKAAGI
ncbi:MAG: PKD domain-containing protein [Phycisphaerae bacterium]|nr:PKD domain-containing protein [Phycisphaerae bacterium]